MSDSILDKSGLATLVGLTKKYVNDQVGNSGGSGGLTKLNKQTIRIWDQEPGLYEWKYTFTGLGSNVYIEYNGAEGTEKLDLGQTETGLEGSTFKAYLLVTSRNRLSTLIKEWYIMVPPSMLKQHLLIYGSTNASEGNYTELELSKIPTEIPNIKPDTQVGLGISHLESFSAGFIFGEGLVDATGSTLNHSSYLYEGNYGFTALVDCVGFPYTITEPKVVHLRTKSSIAGEVASLTHQELTVLADKRTFERWVEYDSSTSTVTPSEWVETTGGAINGDDSEDNTTTENHLYEHHLRFSFITDDGSGPTAYVTMTVTNTTPSAYDESTFISQYLESELTANDVSGGSARLGYPLVVTGYVDYEGSYYPIIGCSLASSRSGYNGDYPTYMIIEYIYDGSFIEKVTTDLTSTEIEFGVEQFTDVVTQII